MNGMDVYQAGGVVLLAGEWVVLRRTPLGELVFPKGYIDPGETPEQAAVREVLEETGLVAEIVGDAEPLVFQLNGNTYHVSLYPMRVVEPTPDWDLHRDRDAVLVPRSEVATRLTFENSRAVWERIARRLPRHDTLDRLVPVSLAAQQGRLASPGALPSDPSHVSSAP